MTLSEKVISRIRKADTGVVVAWLCTDTGRKIEVTRSMNWSREYPDYNVREYSNGRFIRQQSVSLEGAGWAVLEWKRCNGLPWWDVE